MNARLMTFSLLDDSSSYSNTDDSSDPVDGESTDGELVYSVSIDGRSKVQMAAVSGRLASDEALAACLGVLDSVFAAVPIGGTAQVDVGGVDKASETCLEALVAHFAAYLGRGGRLELRLCLGAVATGLLKRLPRRGGDSVDWDDRMERLVVRL